MSYSALFSDSNSGPHSPVTTSKQSNSSLTCDSCGKKKQHQDKNIRQICYNFWHNTCKAVKKHQDTKKGMYNFQRDENKKTAFDSMLW